MSYEYNPYEPYIIRYVKRNNKFEYNKDEIDFLNWMTIVENLVHSKTDITLDDLPDEDYRTNFDNKLSTSDMALIVLKGFFLSYQ